MSRYDLTPLQTALDWVGPAETARLLDFVLIQFCISELDPADCPHNEARATAILLRDLRDACQAIADSSQARKGGSHE